MDDLCRIRLDKKLLNWHIPVPDRVIFQEYFKSLMDVCQKFLEGKASFFIQNYNYSFWLHWLKSIFITYCQFWQKVDHLRKLNQVDWLHCVLWQKFRTKFSMMTLLWFMISLFWFIYFFYSFDGMATIGVRNYNFIIQ